jgi:cyclic nucleotide gated channel
MLEKMNERVLKAICNHLEPMTYTKNSYIIRDGEPLWSMLFITQGTALTYRTSSNSNVNNMGVITSDSSICDCLQKGDFYGEELLNWAFTFASFSELPISTRNIISQTKLEAFSINASDLKSVVSRFQFYFSLMNHPHPERSHLAASFLQLAWGTGGDRKTSGNNFSKLVKSD